MRRTGLAILLLGLAGCLQPTAIDSGIEGTADLGPTCPVQTTGDHSCDDKPYEGGLVLTAAQGTKDVKAFSTSADGTFRVAVAAGTYGLRAEGGSLPACSAEGPITVVAQQFTAVRVHCDTGIR